MIYFSNLKNQDTIISLPSNQTQIVNRFFKVSLMAVKSSLFLCYKINSSVTVKQFFLFSLKCRHETNETQGLPKFLFLLKARYLFVQEERLLGKFINSKKILKSRTQPNLFEL